MDNHQHDHDHSEHAHHTKGHESEVMQVGDNAVQSAFSVGLFLLKGLIAVVAIAWLYSGFYKVENGENAVELFLGKINPYNGSNVRTESSYWNLPFPFTEIIKIPVKKEISVSVDAFAYNPAEKMETADDPLVKGQRTYYLTKDMNLIHLGWDVTFRIKELDKFIVLFYEEGDINKGSGIDRPWINSSRNLIIQLSRAVMIDECFQQNAMDILTGKNINQTARSNLQYQLDKMQTGLEITSFNLVLAAPPSSVSQTFVEVHNAKQRKVQVMIESQKKKEEILLEISAEVKKIELASINEIVELEQSLKSEASRVQTISQLFKDNPIGLKNYLHQLYLEAVAGILADKSVQFINQPENGTYRTSIFDPNKDKSQPNKSK